MTIPYLPDWLPGWAVLVLLVPVVLYALAFLAMPFSVLGLKGRLEAIEARLDELQGEVRALALRLPERGMYLAEAPRPPIPPAPAREGAPRRAMARDPAPHERGLRDAGPHEPAWRESGSDEAGPADPPPPDPSAAPARRPLRGAPRVEPRAEPRREPPRLDWPR